VDDLLTDEGLRKFMKFGDQQSGGVVQQSGGVAQGLNLLVQIGSVSLHFDPAVLVLCWRTIGKLITGGLPPALTATALNSLQGDVLSHVVQELCATIATVSSRQYHLEEDNMAMKREKCVKFLTSLLVRVLGQYTEIAITNVSRVTSLLMTPYPVTHYQRMSLKSNIWVRYQINMYT